MINNTTNFMRFYSTKIVYMWILLIVLFSVSNLRAQQEQIDVLYLKNGSVIKDKILKEQQGNNIVNQTNDEMNVEFIQNDILLIDKLYSDNARDIKSIMRPAYQEKSPFLASMLSLFIPGLGQHYNGQTVKAIIQEVFFLGGITLVLCGKEYWDACIPGEEISGETSSYNELHYIGLGISTASFLWSLIDAPISANKINKKRRDQSFGHFINIDNGRFCVGIDAGNLGRGVGAQLTLHF